VPTASSAVRRCAARRTDGPSRGCRATPAGRRRCDGGSGTPLPASRAPRHCNVAVRAPVRAGGYGAGRRVRCRCVAERATAMKARVWHARAWNRKVPTSKRQSKGLNPHIIFAREPGPRPLTTKKLSRLELRLITQRNVFADVNVRLDLQRSAPDPALQQLEVFFSAESDYRASRELRDRPPQQRLAVLKLKYFMSSIQATMLWSRAASSAFGRIAQLAASAPTRRPSPSNRRFDGAGWDPLRPIAHPPVAYRTGVPMGVLTSPARSSRLNSRQPRLVMQGC